MFGVIPKQHFLLILFLSVATLGCGSSRKGEKTAEVSGTVNYLDGKPVQNGKITFENPEKGEVGGGDIKNGKFSFKAPVGDMVVRISSIEEYGKPDDTGVRPSRQLISSKFNTESTLKKTVKEGGPNNFTFKVAPAK